MKTLNQKLTSLVNKYRYAVRVAKIAQIQEILGKYKVLYLEQKNIKIETLQLQLENAEKKVVHKARKQCLEKLRYWEKKKETDDLKKLKQHISIEKEKEKIYLLERMYKFSGCIKITKRNQYIGKKSKREVKTGFLIESYEQIRNQFIGLIIHGAKRYGSQNWEDYKQEGEMLLIEVYNKKKDVLDKKTFKKYFKASLFRLYKKLERNFNIEVKICQKIDKKVDKKIKVKLSNLSKKSQKILESLKEGFTLEEIIQEAKYSREEIMDCFFNLEKRAI